MPFDNSNNQTDSEDNFQSEEKTKETDIQQQQDSSIEITINNLVSVENVEIKQDVPDENETKQGFVSHQRIQDVNKINGMSQNPLAAWFLGPKAEHSETWAQMLNYIFNDYIHWRRNYFPEDPVIIDRLKRRTHEYWFDKLNTEIDTILNQLKAHFPFYSPRYVAHMLSEQTLPSVVGYFAGMLYNPNNVTDEAAPVTVPLELEVGKMVSEMLGYNPATSWAHICSGGTIANTEALWVARNAQFQPLIIKEFCQKYNYDFEIKTPNCDESMKTRIVDVDEKTLVSLKPNESIFMTRKLASYLINARKQDASIVLPELNSFIQKSQFNVSINGLYPILKKIGLKPKIYVSESAHYCIKKAANILGYGENSVELIPVTSKFRMNVEELENKIVNQKQDEYTACVIGIAGTTEEGALDPIHKIKFLRDKISLKQNKSFWLHIDAAWGGYFRSLFSHPELKKKLKGDLDTICKSYMDKLDIREEFSIVHKGKILSSKVSIGWDKPELYATFLAFPDADSITIDPHKMGYTPYPAGIIAFKNGIVTELITQKAQYISDEKGGLKNIDKLIEINAVGPYILEGSKPGAAAASCYLAHKTIPLETHGHGKIIRTCILNTRKFNKYLTIHKSIFKHIEEEIFGKDAITKNPFTFRPIYDPPDTNVICFIAVPMAWQNNNLIRVDYSLTELNKLNQLIYKKFTIKNENKQTKNPYSQEFFVSRTTIEISQYSLKSVSNLLEQFDIKESEYAKEGIFVLRSTIMNPWHYPAQNANKDYLFDFVIALHKETRKIIDKLKKNGG